MCGRFGLISTPQEVENAFDISGVDPFPPRYNIAPSQPILMVVNASDATGGGEGRKLLLVRWGLIPSWVKDASGFSLLFNARGETAAEKPAFRGAMRHFRTLVPASGFFEWKKKGGGGAEPYWIRPRNGGIIAFAGLMSPWMGADGTELDTGTIVTTASAGVMAGIHARQPVVVAPEDFDRWLDCRNQEPRHVSDLVRAEPDNFFEAIPVSRAVNSARNMGPELIAPVGPVEVAAPKPGDQMDLF